MIFSYYLLVTIFLFLSLALIVLILLQKGRGGGLATAFGGGGGNTAFGTKTGDVLTWATSIAFGLLIVIACSLNLLADHMAHPAAATVSVQAPPGPATPGPGDNSSIPANLPAAPMQMPMPAPNCAAGHVAFVATVICGA